MHIVIAGISQIAATALMVQLYKQKNHAYGVGMAMYQYADLSRLIQSQDLKEAMRARLKLAVNAILYSFITFLG